MGGTKKFFYKLYFKLYFTVAVISLIAFGLAHWYLYCFHYFPVYAMAEIMVPQKEEVKSISVKEDMREWVLEAFKSAGLNPQIADCVIQRESGWQDQRLPSPTDDYGLMQWNIQHIKSGLLNMSCAYDFKCSVRKAINKVKHDGDWHSWYGYRDANCQRFGKI